MLWLSTAGFVGDSVERFQDGICLEGTIAMAHRLHNYTDTENMEDVDKRLPNLIRYLAMAFRPAGVILFCLGLTLVISILCILFMMNNPQDSTVYLVAMAILTGVVASGLVSISIEGANNYRHNRARFVVLNEYLYIISMYESFVEWASHGNYAAYTGKHELHLGDGDFELSNREKAVCELILDVGPIIDKAVDTGKDYLSIKELKLATKVVDAASKIGEYAKDFANDHLNSREYSIYDVLQEPFRTKIKEFSNDVGISLVDDELASVVCDYMLSNIADLELDTKRLIVYCLHNFDEAMHELQRFARREPVVYDNLIPIEERMAEFERKLKQMC